MTLYSEPRNTMEAIEEWAGKGLSIQGQRVPYAVDTQGAQYLRPTTLEYVGYQNLSSTAATAISLTVPDGATFAYVQVTAAPLYWLPATAPTPSSTVGNDAAVGDDIYLTSRQACLNFRAVRNGAVNFTLKALYYRRTVEDAT